MVLCEAVGKVALAFVPAAFESLLGFAILQPEALHAHGLGAALLDGAVGNANGGAVVAAAVGGGLGMSHFLWGDLSIVLC